MYSPAAIDAFAAVKGVFDPDDVLNPGVIVRPRPVDADLRAVSARPLRTNLAFGFQPGRRGLQRRRPSLHRRRQVPGAQGPGVMCPSYRATRDEKDSTRGPGKGAAELANGSVVQGWRAPEVLDSLDLCLSCKACAAECPHRNRHGHLQSEALYQRYRRRPRPAAHYSLGWLPRWAALAALAPGLVNRLASGPLAGPAKRLAGVDPRRDLPRLPPRNLPAVVRQPPRHHR